MENFGMRLAEYLLDGLRHWFWTAPLVLSGFFLYKISSAFLTVKSDWGWRIALGILLGGTSGMVIWVGDNNLLFTLPVFFAGVLSCSRGGRIGRLTVAAILFCLIMPVNALLDTYYESIMTVFDSDSFSYYSNRIIRAGLWGLLYLAVRKRLPDCPPRLSPQLWGLVFFLAAMPFCSLLAVVLMTSRQYYSSPVLQRLILNLGLAVLPFVFLTALALLYALLVLADHERLEQAERLISLRENYYQAIQREDRQVRALRHDLRNHLTAVQGLLEQSEVQKAIGYLKEIAGSPALGGRRRLCENETANVVLTAKAEAMERAGLTADFAVSLPRELPVADLDLCALLGNALDNAIEAAGQARDKKISLRCRTEKGLFMLRVENAVEGELREDLSTTKADKSAHGFGLAGMREIAERYGGSLETRIGHGRFELVACIPLNSG